MCLEKKPELKAFRSSQKWENLEYHYFRELDFLDIKHSIADFKRKREISIEDAKRLNRYSKAYLDDRGNLLRLDYEGYMPEETYILYREGLPTRAFNFKTGRRSGGRVIEDDFLNQDWTYKYNENRLLQDLIWHMYPDLEFRYGLHNDYFVYYSYEYDERGLLRIYQWNEGLTLDGRSVSVGNRVIYDRKRNELLKNHTVSKTAWIPTMKEYRNSVELQLGGNPPTNIRIPLCPKCGRRLTFIYAIELNKPFKNHTMLSMVPIFYCFDCLESAITTELHDFNGNQRLIANENDLFPVVQLHLSRTKITEDEKDAFIKLGGIPDWVQDEEYPTCEKCGKPMMFISQIKSDENYSSEAHALMFGDSGRLYTFACCDIVSSVMQCY